MERCDRSSRKRCVMAYRVTPRPNRGPRGIRTLEESPDHL